MAKISKADVVAFANKFFTPGYVAIYKKQGIDESQKKIDKPAITPIPSNRDLMSQFVKDVQNAKVEPILPAFVDFQKELTFAKTKKGLPVIYKQNTENDLFNLVFRFEFGQQADKRLEPRRRLSQLSRHRQIQRHRTEREILPAGLLLSSRCGQRRHQHLALRLERIHARSTGAPGKLPAERHR